MNEDQKLPRNQMEQIWRSNIFLPAVSQVSKSHYLQCQEPTRLNPEHIHKLSSPKLTGKWLIEKSHSRKNCILKYFYEQ